MKYLLCAILASFILFGCDDGDKMGYRTSNEAFMLELEKSLAENEIPFELEADDYIMYSREYNDAVETIIRNIDQRRAKLTGNKFDDERSTEYFRKLLSERGIDYRTETRADGEWTFWYPENNDQRDEIEVSVVMHVFEQRKLEIDSCRKDCKD